MKSEENESDIVMKNLHGELHINHARKIAGEKTC